MMPDRVSATPRRRRASGAFLDPAPRPPGLRRREAPNAPFRASRGPPHRRLHLRQGAVTTVSENASGIPASCKLRQRGRHVNPWVPPVSVWVETLSVRNSLPDPDSELLASSPLDLFLY
jgi:hypothetical protein